VCSSDLYVAAEVSKGIAATGMQTGVPVIFGIVTTDTLQQALERAGIKSNLGWSYAMSALEMASLMRQVKGIVPVDHHETNSGGSPSTLPATAMQRAIAANVSVQNEHEG